MGQPRVSRRKVVTTSSDGEADDPETAAPAAISSEEDEEPIERAKRSTGKLKHVTRDRKTQSSMPVTSTQDGSFRKSPAKTKSTKVKSKTVTKETSKADAKPIYSFFNATTQRQQLTHPSPSPEKPSTPHEELEVINDDSGEDAATVAFSKGSSTALAMRKRKMQQSQSIEDDASLPPPATQKFRKTSEGGRTPSFSVTNDDKRPWIEQFAPNDLSELAVHKRKVADVRQWLDVAVNGRRQKVLVLKGAAGTGKTATVRLLAKDIGCKVAEWRNPAGFDMTSEGSLSTASQFDDFVRRAGKGASLTFSTGLLDAVHEEYDVLKNSRGPEGEKHVLLIEEFPNTFSRASTTLQSLRSAILQHVSSPPLSEGFAKPIVMVVSETLLSTNTAAADSFTAHRLLGPELINHPYVNTIEFNPVAPTILTKALEAVVVKEARKSGRRKTPGPQVLRRLAENGDIRSAVSSLEFLCLRGDENDLWSSKVAFTKPKKAKADPGMTKAEEEVLKLVSNRENSLGIFHAVGRVVYNNRMEPPSSNALAQPPAWLPQHRRAKVPERDVDSLVDELGTDMSTFLAALHENYVLSCSGPSPEDTLDSLSGCIDNISDADLLYVDRFSFGSRAFSGTATDSLRQDELSFQVAVRGVLFSLPCPVNRGIPYGGNKADAHRMFYPRSLKMWKDKEGVEGILELLTDKAQNGNLNKLTATPKVKEAVSGGGVESWKRSNDFAKSITEPSETGQEDHVIPRLSVTQMEMLLERLPHMAHILGSQEGSLLEQIHTVCCVRQPSATVRDEDEQADLYDGDVDMNIMPEQWTTDKPDADVQASRLQANGRHRARQKQETEGRGLAIPVETSVQKLVLEDDDIVDD